MIIKAIETLYKGYRFRSRLEARWAVFFDALGLEWVYEPEGFDLGGAGWYLPDFFIPELQLWVEVKPCASKITETEALKAEALFNNGGGAVAIVAGKSPSGHLLDGATRKDDGYGGMLPYNLSPGYVQTVFCCDMTDSSGGSWITGFEFVTKKNSGDIAFILPDDVRDGMRQRGFYISHDFEVADRFVHMPESRIAPKGYHQEKAIRAAKLARMARFEHGERA